MAAGKDVATVAQIWYGLELNERELLSRLVLNASDAARICGVTTRQLTYWTDKGLVPCHEGDRRSYDIVSLICATIIRKAMERGCTLGKAAEILKHLPPVSMGECQPPLHTDGRALAQEMDDFLLRLAKRVAVFRVRLPTYLALCNLLRLVGEIQQLAAEQLLEESPFDAAANEAVGQRLHGAVEDLRQALQELQQRSAQLKA